MPNEVHVPPRAARLLLLHADDNVLVALGHIGAGETVECDAASYSVGADLELGHKIARRPIAKGDVVLKYGAPIGRAGADIARSEHVHLHNIISQYTVIEDMDK